MKTRRKNIKPILMYTALILLACTTVMPFIYLLCTALKGPTENLLQYPPTLIPQEPTLNNFVRVYNTIPIFRYMLNSALVAGVTIALQLVFCAMAAYPLARMEFKGKHIIFMLIMSTMFLPGEVTLIPLYVMIAKTLQLKNSLLGVLIPGMVGAFGIFLMRQAFFSIPKEMEEAAIIDGCSTWKIFFKIMLPMVKPTLGTLAIFTFINSWNNFLFPLLLLEKKEIFTLPVGLMDLHGTFSTDLRLVAAGATIALIPIIIVFVSLQKYFVEGVTAGAVKG